MDKEHHSFTISENCEFNLRCTKKSSSLFVTDNGVILAKGQDLDLVIVVNLLVLRINTNMWSYLFQTGVDVVEGSYYRRRDLKTICHEIGHNLCCPHTHHCQVGQVEQCGWGFINGVPVQLDGVQHFLDILVVVLMVKTKDQIVWKEWIM